MKSLEVAGVAGTWVAAGLAVIALVGIIGPLLVWKASQTRRQLAIDTVRDTTQKYISKGVHLGPNIHLFRRVRAPLLGAYPTITDSSFIWNSKSLDIPDSLSSWPKFSSLLTAYGVHSETGNVLIIENGRTLLPVHRIWIFAFGIIGRYSERTDEGKQLLVRRMTRFQIPQAGRTPLPRPLGAEAYFVTQPWRQQRRSQYPETAPSDDSTEDEAPPSYNVRLLAGITGSLKIRTPKHIRGDSASTTNTTKKVIVSVSAHSVEEIGKVAAENLPIKDLVLLALGCLPVKGKPYLYLADTEQDPHDYSSDSDNDNVRMPRASNRRRAVPHRSRRTRTMHEEPPLDFHDPRRKPRSTSSGIRAVELVQLQGDVAVNITRAFGITEPEILGTADIRLTASLINELEEYSSRTIVPASMEWVRIEDEASTGHHKDIYIRRSDAQKLAYALLTLAWHPESYLLGCDFDNSMLARLISKAADILQTVITRLVNGIDNLAVDPEERRKLLAPLEAVLDRVEKAALTRGLMADFYKLDEVLACLPNRNPQISEMLGILMITNREFAKLVSDSTRHLQSMGSPSSRAEVNLRAGTVKIPSGFGVMTTFVVDLGVLYPEETNRSQQPISIEYTDLILGCLKGCVRSAMLRNCLQSFQLLDAVLEMPDLIFLD